MKIEQRLYNLTSSRAKSGDPEVVNFTLGKLPDARTRARIKRLSIDTEFKGKALPEELAEFPALEYFAVDGDLVHTLTSEIMPATLRMLNVVSDETTKYALADELVLPQLTSLVGFTKLAFRADQLTNVADLEVKLASPAMADEIAQLPLRSLGIGPLSDGKQLATFAELPLTSLSILGGNVTSLRGVEQFAKLEALRVKRLTKLTNIGAIADLTKLRELALEWCPKLGKLDAIGKLTKLKELDLWASKVPVPAWTKLEPILQKRKVVIANFPDNIDEDDDYDDD
jgi:hypothetical protein